jgi:hypothetical protein
MTRENLFHISDNPRVRLFEPLPAPYYVNIIMENVVFAISDKMLHNYLLPRNCPRVTFYAGPETSETDKRKFLGTSTAGYVICVESGWLTEIQRTTLYRYEFLPETFTLFDECAGYYISQSPVIPVSAKPVYNLMEELLKRNVELRFMPSITELGKLIQQSTLNYSLIRMQYAKTQG